MNKYLTYYNLLGVEPNATKEEIIKAFKEKAKEYHPDKNKDHNTAKELFQYVLEAKDILIDDEKRLEYDYMAGIKSKPKKKKSWSENYGTLIFIGAITLLVGIFIGNSRKR